jgi:hypothetical protein
VESESRITVSLATVDSFVVVLATGKHDAETTAMIVSSALQGERKAESGKAVHRETGILLRMADSRTKPA